jgi:hypothetical protein
MTKARNYLILAAKTLVVWGIFMYYMVYVDLFHYDVNGTLTSTLIYAHLAFTPFLLIPMAFRKNIKQPLKLRERPIRMLFGTFFGGQVILFIVSIISVILLPVILGNPFFVALLRSMNIMGSPPIPEMIRSRSEILLYVIPATFFLHYSILAFDSKDERTFAQRFTSLTGLKTPTSPEPGANFFSRLCSVIESKERFKKVILIGIVAFIAHETLYYGPLGNPRISALKTIYFPNYTERWYNRKKPIEMQLPSTMGVPKEMWLPSSLQLRLYVSYSPLQKLAENNWWATHDLTNPIFGAKYSSSDPEVADVTNMGLVTAHSMGEAKIRAELGNCATECPVVVYSLDKYGRRMIHEKKPITRPDLSKLPSLKFLGMEYAKGSELLLYVGDKSLLRVNGRFFDKTASEDVTYDLTGSQYGTAYVSSDPSVAAVSRDGTLVALTAGKAEITARNRLDQSVSKVLSVTVHDEEDFYPKPDLSRLPFMRLEETTAIIGYKNNSRAIVGPQRNFHLLLSVEDKCILPVIGFFYSEDPSRSSEMLNLTGKQFGTVYTSDAPLVAVVSDDGRLEALAQGEAKITADNIFKERKTQSPIIWYVEVMEK